MQYYGILGNMIDRIAFSVVLMIVIARLTFVVEVAHRKLLSLFLIIPKHLAKDAYDHEKKSLSFG